ALLDSQVPGHVSALLRAEGKILRARAGFDEDPRRSLDDAITMLRLCGSPYHLANGLLDHASYLLEAGDPRTAEGLLGEARSLGQELRAGPLLDRVEKLFLRLGVIREAEAKS
ncbi:MAG: hypothetical protein WAM97_18985, partial [Acidimicrobiales bacterium]